MNQIRITGNTIAIRFDYDPEHVATVKGIAKAHAVPAIRAYDALTRTWRLPVTCADDLAQAFGSFQWCDQFRAMMRGRPSKLAPAAAIVEKHAPEPMAVSADLLASLTQPLPDGRVPRLHQQESVAELVRERRRIVGHDMGCIDGDAVLHINRASNGFKTTLREAFVWFNKPSSRKDPNIPTKCRALCGEELRQHTIKAILSKGTKPVLRLETSGGKSIRLTPDHEVATPKGWTRADALRVGDEVLTNGRKFGSSNPNWKGGANIDDDGYVRCSGHATHPRNTTGGVYEHILVMEKHIGRHVERGEHVHHKNGIKHDNRIENLEILTAKEHLAAHKAHRRINGSISAKGGEVWMIPVVQTVKFIAPDGETDVYDVVMEDPHRNFVANGIVVHNCGKTLTALLAGKLLWETEHLRTVIIAPANLMENWRREAYGAGCKAVSVYSSAKIPTPPSDGYFLACDEAHFFQSLSASRTKKMLALALAPQCQGVALLSGTPMKNGLPINLFPLLRAIKHPLGDNQTAYEARYCGKHRRTLGNARVDDATRRVSWKCKCSMDNRQPWSPRTTSYRCGACGHAILVRSFIVKNGATNLDELRALIAPVLMRKLKSECLDLPPKTLMVQDVEPSDEMRAKYDAALTTAKERYKARVESGEVSSEGEALALMTMVRMAASLAKVEATVEIARDIIEQGSKPVIFAEFKESARAIAKALDLRDSYDGDMRPADRQALMDDFQRGKTPAFVGTRASAGTGHNLTAGDYVILMDRGLTPGDNDQAADRLHRDGQKRNVTVIWPVAFSIDKTIDALNARKQGVIGQVIDGRAGDGGTGRTTAHEVMKELCK